MLATLLESMGLRHFYVSSSQLATGWLISIKKVAMLSDIGLAKLLVSEAVRYTEVNLLGQTALKEIGYGMPTMLARAKRPSAAFILT